MVVELRERLLLLLRDAGCLCNSRRLRRRRRRGVARNEDNDRNPLVSLVLVIVLAREQLQAHTYAVHQSSIQPPEGCRGSNSLATVREIGSQRRRRRLERQVQEGGWTRTNELTHQPTTNQATGEREEPRVRTRE